MPWGCEIALRNSGGFLLPWKAGVKHTSDFLLHRWFKTYIKNNWVYFFSTSQMPSFVLLFVFNDSYNFSTVLMERLKSTSTLRSKCLVLSFREFFYRNQRRIPPSSTPKVLIESLVSDIGNKGFCFTCTNLINTVTSNPPLVRMGFFIDNLRYLPEP